MLLLLRMTGINAVMFYSSKIFSYAGVENDLLASVSVMALNVVSRESHLLLRLLMVAALVL